MCKSQEGLGGGGDGANPQNSRFSASVDLADKLRIGENPRWEGMFRRTFSEKFNFNLS